MSHSNRNGTAFEFAAKRALADEIASKRESKGMKPISDIVLVHDERYTTLFTAYVDMQNNDPVTSSKMYEVGRKAAKMLLESEPALWAGKATDVIHIFANRNGGEEGDVRDIYIHRIRGDKIIRNIGISLKWNHDAVKHSRISHSIDFGNMWIDSPTSDLYWNVANPIFRMLQGEAEKKTEWKHLPNKSNGVYKPLCEAMVVELNRMLHEEGAPASFVRYVVGRKDFHKIIGKNTGEAKLQTYSFDGTLSQALDNVSPKGNTIGHTPLPTKLLGIEMPRNNTIVIQFDNGWGFNLRIHSASTNVEASLKFDIRTLPGLPVQTFSSKDLAN